MKYRVIFELPEIEYIRSSQVKERNLKSMVLYLSKVSNMESGDAFYAMEVNGFPIVEAHPVRANCFSDVYPSDFGEKYDKCNS